MAAASRLLLILTALRLSVSLRLGEDDELARRKPKAEAKKLEKFFGDAKKFPQGRYAIEKATSKIDDGDGEANMMYKYLNTDCLKGRARHAAIEFANAGGCKRLLEIGGYLTPFPKASKKSEADWAKDMVVYVNVDPSANETKLEDLSPDYPSVTLKNTMEEFADSPILEKLAKLDKPFDCFLMLGVNAQVAWKEPREALKKLVAYSKIAILEIPQGKADKIAKDQSKPIMEQAGFSLANEKTVDCSSDDEAKGLLGNFQPAALIRDVMVYKKMAGKQEAKR